MKKLAVLLAVCMLFQCSGIVAFADDIINDDQGTVIADETLVQDENDVIQEDDTVIVEDQEKSDVDLNKEEEDVILDDSGSGAVLVDDVDGDETLLNDNDDGELPEDAEAAEDGEELEGDEADVEEELDEDDVEAMAAEDFVFEDPSTKKIILRLSDIGLTKTGVTIPDSVTTIHDGAFAEAPKLTAISIPAGVTSIGPEAFRDCKVLDSVGLSSGLTEIANGMFSGCVSLSSITWSNTITKIGDNAFTNCVSLKSLSLPSGVTTIGSNAFLNCAGLTTLTLPSSLTTIGDGAFENCSRITNTIEFPASLTTIGAGAFAKCTGTTEILLPNTVTSLGERAFEGCTSVAKLTLSTGLTEIPNFAFRNCSSIASITIPSGVTKIGREAFYNCSKATHVDIPDSVTTILARAFAGIASGATVYCYAKPTLMDTDCIAKNAVIYGHANSSSNTYATKNGNKFIPIEMVEFVKRCYKELLGREADQAGLIDKVNQLAAGTGAASIVSSILKSQEFKNRNLNNDAIVEAMYKAMLNRAADPSGKAAKVKLLEDGVSYYDYLVNNLASSGEFQTKICKPAGMNPGSITMTENRDKNLRVTQFVSRCYKEILNRKADVNGLNNWTGQLLNKTIGGGQVVAGFVSSPEFINRKLSTEDSVEMLYKVMLDRASDAQGKTNWVTRVKDGVSLKGVVNGFANSNEFKRLCRTYGIEAGSVSPLENRDKNIPVTQFVARCYRYALGRTGDINGLNNWTGKLISKSVSPASAVRGFVFSDECKELELTNAEFVTMLYNLCFGRAPDTTGYNNWMSRIAKGMTREQVVKGFTSSAEFTKMVKSYGL